MVMPQWCVINEFENAGYLQPRLRIRLVEILFFFETRPNETENRMLSNRNRHDTQVSRISENGHPCRACQSEWIRAMCAHYILRKLHTRENLRQRSGITNDRKLTPWT